MDVDNVDSEHHLQRTDNANRNSFGADDHDDTSVSMEQDDDEKDALYSVLAPKSSIAQQLEEMENDNDDAYAETNVAAIEAAMAKHQSYATPVALHEDEVEPANTACSKSAVKATQRSWVDEWEPAVQATFYRTQIGNGRPTYQIVSGSIRGNTAMDNFVESEMEIADESCLHTQDNDSENVALQNQQEIVVHTTPAQTMQTIAQCVQVLPAAFLTSASTAASAGLGCCCGSSASSSSFRKKFGAWDGVFAGCLLNIFCVIMFLRIGFVVGQAGIIGALGIMALSSGITLLTAMSMSAICTNGKILAGGAYYIISRALGPSVGGAVGVLFSIGSMCMCSLYLVGFAETLVANLAGIGFQIFADPVADVRVWSNVLLVVVVVFALLGLRFVIKAQLALLLCLVCAVVLFFSGAVYRSHDNVHYPNPAYPDECVDYIDGCAEFITRTVITPNNFINGNFLENLTSDYQDGYDFWAILAIFFPAVTGIMAGANISVDLRDPSQDIPKGTLTAIAVTSLVYMFMGVVAGAVTDRYELLNNGLVLSYICVSEYIIWIVVYAAALSAAIASLVGAPRMLQAVANDNLFPFRWLRWFTKPDANGLPSRGYLLSFVVAFGCNLLGDLNRIAPLISQFFLLTYMLINFACFSLEMSRSPGWRPRFQFFSAWTSGAGALLCLVVMFLLNWVYALVACIAAFTIYAYVEWNDPEVNWGAAPQARAFYSAYSSVLKLRKTKKHIKNWRPGLLVLVRDPIKRAQMMLYAQTLKKAHGPIFYATVHTGDYSANIGKFHYAHSPGYLPENVPKNSTGFYEAVLAESFRLGVQNLFQLTGLGSMRPNTLLIGYKRRWQSDSDAVVHEYVQVLRDTLLMGMGLMIAVGFKRINWFLMDYAPPALQHDIDAYADKYVGGLRSPETHKTQQRMNPHRSAEGHERGSSAAAAAAAAAGEVDVSLAHPETFLAPAMQMPRNQQQAENALYLTNAWAAGQGKDTVIDVWWMIDDGGFCMLLPYIMKLHKFWSRCTLRMLLVAEEDALSTDVSTMRSLISKFRLPYQGPLLVRAKKEPDAKTVEQYEQLAKCKLSETPRPEVIKKWLILSELLFEYSRYSGLNVVTLPIPTKNMKPTMYMALLHMLSDQQRLPPTMIMRGNGDSTLTFYSE